MNYDSTERSTRTVEVIFERYADALKAYDEYDGRTLDGRAMQIILENLNFQNEERSDENKRGEDGPAGKDISTGVTK